MKRLLFVVLVLCLAYGVSAATLTGSVYNSQLELEGDVVVEVNSIPPQKLLAKDGRYSFELSQGEYVLSAYKGLVEVKEEIVIETEGVFVYDMFLLSDLSVEEELWQGTEEEFFVEGEEVSTENDWWKYVLFVIVVIFAGMRFIRVRKKLGPLKKFREEVRAESKKTVEEHKQEIATEPGYVEKVLEIIEKEGGRITQKKLRQEMLPLSEAKVSLVVTELEHKGKVEKIKKGRGNIIIMK